MVRGSLDGRATGRRFNIALVSRIVVNFDEASSTLQVGSPLLVDGSREDLAFFMAARDVWGCDGAMAVVEDACRRRSYSLDTFILLRTIFFWPLDFTKAGGEAGAKLSGTG